jgi:cytoskeletal protein CcmA (bactofilin family)
VELAAKAEIRGNVYYDLIEMVMGSRVDGKLVKICAGEDANQQTAAKAEPSPVNSTDNEDQVETKDALASQKSPLHVTSVKSKTA